MFNKMCYSLLFWFWKKYSLLYFYNRHISIFGKRVLSFYNEFLRYISLDFTWNLSRNSRPNFSLKYFSGKFFSNEKSLKRTKDWKDFRFKKLVVPIKDSLYFGIFSYSNFYSIWAPFKILIFHSKWVIWDFSEM